MKVACFVMMRNESPILGPFLDQADALFDRCIVLNHGSTDDSAAMVLARDVSRFSLFHLKSPGYPQSIVASYFAHDLLLREQFDFLFLLDCDEFLPFTSRAELEGFLYNNKAMDVLRLPWLNVCPKNFDGGNIFSSAFVHSQRTSIFHKVVLNKSIAVKAPDFTVLQGYHDVATTGASDLKKLDCRDTFCIHIPIQSRVQFGFKLANGNNRLLHERTNLKKGNGYHWVDLAKQFAAGGLDSKALRTLALNYPAVKAEDDAEPIELKFSFPYVKSDYRETQNYIASQIASLISFAVDQNESMYPHAFSVVDSAGKVVFTDGSIPAGPSNLTDNRKTSTVRPFIETLGSFAEDFSSLVEPLFNLPTKLPVTAWQGHIPFMFVLFKLLRPRTYVELGVHNGASLIAACTAAKSYNLDTTLYGIDSWQGDDHAGNYDGNRVYAELKTHLDANFRNVKLMRCFFAEAREHFRAESIDLLHIDGLHTYDAVKEDFTTWLEAMAPSGVILFHDTCVYDRGFGVHRFWAELKELFTTVEFHHSHGLGVLFLDPHDNRIGPLTALASNHNRIDFYEGLVSMVAGVLPERMGYFSTVGILEERDREIVRLQSELVSTLEERDREIMRLQSALETFQKSTSWRITAPLRALKRHG